MRWRERPRKEGRKRRERTRKKGREWRGVTEEGRREMGGVGSHKKGKEHILHAAEPRNGRKAFYIKWKKREGKTTYGNKVF